MPPKLPKTIEITKTISMHSNGIRMPSMPQTTHYIPQNIIFKLQKFMTPGQLISKIQTKHSKIINKQPRPKDLAAFRYTTRLNLSAWPCSTTRAQKTSSQIKSLPSNGTNAALKRPMNSSSTPIAMPEYSTAQPGKPCSNCPRLTS